MKTILVTGASGFVGQPLCVALEGAGFSVRRAVRKLGGDAPGQVAVGNLGANTDWRAALAGVDSVAHLAARVHVMRDRVQNPLEAFRAVNVRATEHLARQAAQAGVRRLLYVSSIKVNGERTVGQPFTDADAPAPQDPYAVSKWEAEQALHRVAAETGLEIVILRPPLVYGPGVKANFLRLTSWVARGLPLPLAWANNRRSLLGLHNLVSAIQAGLTHPAAAGRTFLVSDGEAVSTATLIRKLAQALERPARLWPLPPLLLRAVGQLMGKGAEVSRLLDSLDVDSSGIRHALGWTPPETLEQGLRQVAAGYWHGERR